MIARGDFGDRAKATMPVPRQDEWIVAAMRLAGALGVTEAEMWAALLLTRSQVIPDPWRAPDAARKVAA